MGKIISMLCCLACIISWGMTRAQVQSLPVRIDKIKERYTETNSKNGSQKRTKHYLELVYDDGTKEKLTENRLKDLLVDIPEAQNEWKKYRNNQILKAASLPLLAFGFVNGIQFFNTDKENIKQRHAIIGALSFASGLSVLWHFDKEKLRHQDMMIAYCNRKWQSKGQNFHDIIKPDILRVGSVNNSGIGLALTWHLR